MNKKTTLSLFLLFTAFALQLSAQDLVGTSSITFDNSDPCVIDLSFQYTNAGSNDAGAFKTGIYLTEDMFFADPDFDILVTEIYNAQGCTVGQTRTITATNQDISQLPGFTSGTNYFVYYYLDSGLEVSESNENNNLASLGNTTCTLVGVDQPLADEIALTLFPNPAADVAALSMELTQMENISVRMYDLSGKMVHEVEENSYAAGRQVIDLDLAGQAPGLYSVQIQMGSRSVAKKLIVK